MDVHEITAILQRLKGLLSTRIIAQNALVDALITASASSGHILLEGPPGTGKTQSALALSQILGRSFKRISFTADMMPSDLVGSEWYHPGKGTFQTRLGPIHHDIVLADEINRSPARVQSALLEAMSERQVTIGDTTYPLSPSHLIIATANTLDHEGTYALPEAQLDRFAYAYTLTYPSIEDEVKILQRAHAHPLPDETLPIDLENLRNSLVQSIQVSDEVMNYTVRLISVTRQGDMLKWTQTPLGQRAARALVDGARVRAALQNRDYVTSDDIVALAPLCLLHRIATSYTAQGEGITREWILDRMIERTPVWGK